MLEEHKRLQSLLKECKNNLNSSSITAEELFIKFKWNLEKHFFLEEKVIFSNPAVENSEHIEEVDKILEEHKEILGFIKFIESEKINKDNLEKLINLRHKKINL